MRKDEVRADKNLINTVEKLSVRPVNSQEAQQGQQARNDRNKRAKHKHKP